MNELIDSNFTNELNRMEMLGPEGAMPGLYFVADKDAAEPRIRIALEKAAHYKADAIFFRIFPVGVNQSPVPQIYIYYDTSLSFNEAKYAEIHRRLWNAGIPPLVFILTAGRVKVLNCRQEPEIDKNSQQTVFTPFNKLEKIIAVDRSFAARQIAAGTFWEDPKFRDDFVLEKTAYLKLLEFLKSFRKRLLDSETNTLSEPTVNRILVMAILLKYLDERRDSAGNKVFPKRFPSQFSVKNEDNIEAIFREKGSCIKLFDNLSKHFNGGIFELTAHEKNELSQADLSMIASFLKGNQEPDGQMLFWPLYSFEDLPVELISNIYEVFLAKKAKDKIQGVFYTPPMLVEFLMDKCLPLEAKSLSMKILDPACGSGIFPVCAFKRLIQCWRIANDWKKPSYHDLKAILKNNIFGIDKASEAVLITAFSLCIALCDELEPLIIWNELKFDNLQDTNLKTDDFFKIVQSGDFNDQFDLIIGNPPFDSNLTGDAAKEIEKTKSEGRPKLPDNQLALLFLEQAFQLARKDATVCLIQPAGPLLYNSGALPFRGYLFEKFDINQVFDFSPLAEVLFSKAKVAAAAVIAFNRPPIADKILHITFRRTRAVKEKLLFELDPYDFHWLSREDVNTKQYVWKTNLLGGGRLHRIVDKLINAVPTLGEYLERKRENAGWQFGVGYTVGCGRVLNSSPDVKDLIKLSSKERMLLFKLKIPPLTADWITGKQQIPSKALNTKGITWKFCKPCDNTFFQRTCSDNRDIFSPPHVLIRKIVEVAAIPAVYTEELLVFTQQIVGLYAPENEKRYLQLLAKRLNDSNLFGILSIVLSGRILVGRSNSLNMQDIMALPYPDDLQDIELNFWEQALIDDIEHYLIDFQRNGEQANILSKTNKSDLFNFGKMYCSILNPVYKEFQPLEPIRLGSFICYPFCYGDAPKIEIPDKDKIIPFLDELLNHRQGSRLFINRILRLYEQNIIFMVKPDQKRYWLRSIALRDADETMIDMLEQGY
jgi:type I restriction-modification system DNA methylase subunit